MASADESDYWIKGFADCEALAAILDVLETEKVNFALEVHPTEIAFDIPPPNARSKP